MTSVVLGIGGAVVGGYFGGPTGARIGYLVGSGIGSYVDQKQLRNEGPRLSDKRFMTSVYGNMIPICRGTIGIAGNVIWAVDLQEESSTEESGGKGGPSTVTTLYSYFANFAVSLCEGPIMAIQRIWANGRLWYDANATSQGYTQWTLYPGSETQLPDPTIESFRGVGNVPAYRGQAYIVFDHLPVEQLGNRIPQLFFELVEDAAISNTTEIINQHAYVFPTDAPEFSIWASDGTLYGGKTTTTGNNVIKTIDPITGNYLSSWTGPVGIAGLWICMNVPISGGRFYGLWSDSSSAFIVPILVTPGVTYEKIKNQANTDDEKPAFLSMMTPIGDDLLYLAHVNPTTAFARRVSVATKRVITQGATNIGNVNHVWQAQHQFPYLQYGSTDGTNYYAANQRDTGTSKYTIWKFDATTLALLGSVTAPVAGLAGNVLYYQGKLYIGCTVSDTDRRVDKYDATTLSFEGSVSTLFAGSWIAITTDPRYLIVTNGGAMWGGVLQYDGMALVNLQTFTFHSDIHFTTQQPWHVGPYQLDTLTGRMITLSQTVTLWRLIRILINLVGSNTIPLSSVVASYLERVGVSATNYDVSQLAAVPVRGTMISRPCSVRQAIEPLTRAYTFDGIESGGVIKFVRRGGTVVAAIEDDELVPR